MTGSGLSAFAAERSASALTSVFAVSELLCGFGSLVELATVTVLQMNIPLLAPSLTFTTSVNLAVALEPNVAMLQPTVPVPPTGGVLQVNAGPLFCASETNVVFAGMSSLTHTFWAGVGPALAMVRA